MRWRRRSFQPREAASKSTVLLERGLTREDVQISLDETRPVGRRRTPVPARKMLVDILQTRVPVLLDIHSSDEYSSLKRKLSEICL